MATSQNSTARPGSAQPVLDEGRVPWVDYAKGICIIMVVMMHTTLGVEKYAGATSWLGGFIEFAKPFRMPDFFLISGLFLARVIDRDWRTYLDRKVVHFLYFYVLWFTIQWVMKTLAPAFADSTVGAALLNWGSLLWDPPGTLWFIYILPVFFVLAKLARSVPPAIVLGLAALLQIVPHDTGWFIADEFCERLVFFLVGYYAARHVFAFAGEVGAHKGRALAGLAAWACANGTLVWLGIAHAPGIGLGLGLVGALAVITAAVLAAGVPWLEGLRYCGRHSLVIYLAFFIPMAGLRAVLLRWGWIEDLGTISAIVTVVSVIVPLLLYRLARGTRLALAFERPGWARLPGTRRKAGLVPAE